MTVPSITALVRVRAAGGAALAALILMTAAAAPIAGAMPPDGYEPVPETSEPSEPVQAPKPGTPAVYCITACTGAFDASVSSPTTSRVDLSWPGASGYTGYVIERRKTSLAGSFGVVAQLGATARTYTDTGLTDNTGYDYRVTATGASVTASSNVIAVRTLPMPTTLSADNATTRSADLHWNGTTGAAGYSVERRGFAMGGSFVTVANLDATARGFRDTDLAHSTAYEYRVRATGVTGLGPSNEVALHTWPPQVERVRLGGTEQYRFGGRGSDSAPPGARILSVRNVTLGQNNAQLLVTEVVHQSADRELRSHAQLGYNAITGAFNGQLAKGSWSLWVPAFSGFLWDCDGASQWSTSCNDVAVFVGLEVTWA